MQLTVDFYKIIELILSAVTATAVWFAYRQLKVANVQAASSMEQARLTAEQARLTAEQVKRSTYLEFEASLFELSKLVIANPEVHPYFYDKKPMPSKNENHYSLVRSFSIFYLDFFDHVATMEEIFPGETLWHKNKWDAWIIDMFCLSPSLLHVLMEEEDWYHQTLRELSRKAKFRLGDIISS